MSTSRSSVRSRRRLALLALVPVAPMLLSSGWASTASADDPPPPVPADGSHYVWTELGYTGAPQSFTVPAGVTMLEVTAYGASGGSARPNDGTDLTALGGRGAAVSAFLDVVPGTVLSVNVGGQGGDNGNAGGDGAAGWNGGGAGGAASVVGAGGGGATDLRTCAPEATDCGSLASRILVAAGGGGAGFGYDNVIAGADAGAAGEGYTTSRGTVEGGQPGTATAGGAGGDASNENEDRISRGGDGALGSGGVGGGRTGPDYVPTIQENAGAGGGGGGLYGGGGGGDNRFYGAAGGGGSTLVPFGGGLGMAGPDMNGTVYLTYDLGPITTVGVDLDDITLPASGVASTVVTVSPRTANGTGLTGMQVTLSSSDPGQSFGPVTEVGDSGDYTAVLHGSTTVGTASILAVVAGETTSPSGAATVETVAYAPPAITAALSSAQPRKAGWYRTPVTATFTCTGSRPVDCPAPTTLSGNGKNQVVSRTITDDQGFSDSVTLSVSIDRAKPTVKVTGAKNGATYAAARNLTCKATDTLSGVASCQVTTTKKKSGRTTLVRWTGTAKDKAGNVATTKGGYTIRKR